MSKTLLVAIAAVALVGIGLFAFVPKSNSTPNTSTNTSQQSPVQVALAEVSAGKAQLFDVRTPEEFASGHAKLATNFDSVKVQNGDPFPADKNATIYLYCRSGNRAGQVETLLKNQGYTNVTNLGGLSEMQAAGAF